MSRIYQLEHTVENVGRHKAESKKRIRWVYEVDSVLHELVFLWSMQSGKEEVTLNGTILQLSKHGRGVVDEQLTPELHMVCTKTAPNGSPPGFRCFELLIHEKPFHTYPSRRPDSSPPMDYGESSGFSVPMSILDILFPGKYGNNEPPTPPSESEVEYEYSSGSEHYVPMEDPAPVAAPAPPAVDLLAFDNDGSPPVGPPIPMPPAAAPTQDGLLALNHAPAAPTVESPFGDVFGSAPQPQGVPPQQQQQVATTQQPSNPYANDLLGFGTPSQPTVPSPVPQQEPQQQQQQQLATTEQPSYAYSNDLLGFGSAAPAPTEQTMPMVESQTQANPYANDVFGSPAPVPMVSTAQTMQVVPNPAQVDPFANNVFGAPAPAPAAPTEQAMPMVESQTQANPYANDVFGSSVPTAQTMQVVPNPTQVDPFANDVFGTPAPAPPAAPTDQIMQSQEGNTNPYANDLLGFTS
eukprot:CAMPEP_0198283720 /NCGR_PEP_ID=MMETSP1449-20131203/3300_1 /TAXON_ID=420275 /ORGANISM="Attheya septentrionalis, Strain CCMP2084" /LENGTH=464 /DNA_ID=CAMNT_0043980491 /DNA_START=248 /DNA_END=1642 /DNA_ORIENTATION=+